MTAGDNATILVRNLFRQQTNLVHFSLQLVQRSQADKGNQMRSKLSEWIEGPWTINVEHENDRLDNDSLLDKGLLMVDGELRGQQRDDSASQSVVAELRCKQTMQTVELNAAFNLKIEYRCFAHLI